MGQLGENNNSAAEGSAIVTEEPTVEQQQSAAEEELKKLTAELDARRIESDMLNQQVEQLKQEQNKLEQSVADLKQEAADLYSELEEKRAAIGVLNNTTAAEEKQITIRFSVPSFRHNGVEYNSAAVEEAHKNGDLEASQVIADLVQMKSGIIEIINEGGE